VQDISFNVLCISALKLISLFDAPLAYKAGAEVQQELCIPVNFNVLVLMYMQPVSGGRIE
jgi:hypothetical protein